jgi:tRNA (guanine26-N2/guanine27-N2)-dimethyltransferase
MKSSPPKLEKIIEKLRNKGFVASPTSFSPTGFRTNANIKEITSEFSD